MKQTLYQVLGVDPTASAEDIAAACKRLSARTDWPDSYMPGLLRHAHEILTDPARRRHYDASLAAPAQPVRESDVDASPGFVEAWGKWIVIVAALAGVTAWWTSRSTPPPAAPAPVPAMASDSSEAPPLPVGEAPRSIVESPKEPAAPAVRAAAQSPAAARSAEDVFADVAPSVARVNVMDGSGNVIGTGSGVVIDDAVTLTSCHVATLGPKLAVKIGQATMPATILLADEAFDLCRLSVPGLRSPAVTIGSVTTLRTGQRVYAIGAPQGLELTISEGIVSALRKVDEGTVIQTTAPISPGSSGGGLFDVSGRLVGIMTFQHRFGQNLNFALPADWIAQMRERKASEGGWRTASVSDPSQPASAAALIIGRWLCRDWTSGRTATYTFEIDGRVGIALDTSQAATLKYGVSGRTLQLSDAKQAFSLAIAELTSQKMILHGRERSIACERP